MTLVLTLLLDDPDNADSLTYTTAAVTPAADSGIVVCVHYTTNSTLDPPALDTPDWLSGSWTQEAVAQAGTQGLVIFSGKATSSPSSDDLTATFGVTQAGCGIGIVQVTGQDATDFVVQTATDTGPSATAASVTLPGALVAATSIVLAAIGITENVAIDPANSETELLDNGHNQPTRRMQIQYKLNDATSSWTFASAIHRAAAIEIKEAAASSEKQATYYRRMRSTSR